MWWTALLVLAVAGAWWLPVRPRKAPPADPHCERALAAFRAKYPHYQAFTGSTSERGRDGSVVVTIVDMRAEIPPHRSWWRIDENGVEELDHERAIALVDIPVWR